MFNLTAFKHLSFGVNGALGFGEGGVVYERCPYMEARLYQNKVTSAIVRRGDWLWKRANIEDENDGAQFFIHKLRPNKLMQCFYLSVS